MSLNSQDKIMIIITAIVMFIELFIFYFNNVSSKSAQMRRYALNGGTTKAKRVADNEYHFIYEEKEYVINVPQANNIESIEVFFNVNNPSQALSPVMVNKSAKRLLAILPVLPVIILVIVYKIIYR